jgi:YbgC/YbaW family acyl-CoA thioester hydrolase
MTFMFRYHARVALAYFRWRWAGKPRATESRLTFKATAADCDWLNHINNARYLEFLDAGRVDLFLRLGIMEKASREKWHMVVGGLQIRYRKEVRRGAKFTLISQFLRIDGKSMVVEQKIYVGDVEATAAEVQVLAVRGGKVVAPDFLLPLLAPASAAA